MKRNSLARKHCAVVLEHRLAGYDKSQQFVIIGDRCARHALGSLLWNDRAMRMSMRKVADPHFKMRLRLFRGR